MKKTITKHHRVKNNKEENDIMKKQKQKNNNKLLQFTNVVLLITMFAIILVAGTYAKYTSSASGTDATVVAKWSFKVNGEEIAVEGDAKTVNFGLFDTINDSNGQAETDVKEGLIAPGTKGAFEFELKNTSDVTAKYDIKLNVDNEDIPLEFSFDGETWKSDLESLVATDIMANGSTKNVVVNWRWAFGEDVVTDATLGAQTVTVGASITATQVDSLDEAAVTYEEKQIFPNILTEVPESRIASLAQAKYAAGPFPYANTELFAGKTITKIGIPIMSVSAIDNNQKFTISVVDKNKVANKQPATVIRSYVVKPKAEDLGSNPSAVNKWVYIDLSDNPIVLSEDETLAFGSSTDTIFFGHTNANSQPIDSVNYGFWANIGGSYQDCRTGRIYLDIYYKEKTIGGNENTTTAKTLKDVLTGKNFSILGDSISTYKDISNDTTNTNATLGTNTIYYGTMNTSVKLEETWWMQTVTDTGMKLLVNNSSGGAKVVGNGNVTGTTVDQGIGIRPQNLHDNVGENAGTNPDIIAVYMGINDFNANFTAGTYEAINFDTLITNTESEYSYATPTNFAEGYAIMLHKIKTAYPKADVFVMNFPLRSSSPSSLLTSYNDVISKLVTKYNMNLVDLYSSEISGTVYSSYSVGDNLHPNASGMELMTKALEDAMKTKYLNN